MKITHKTFDNEIVEMDNNEYEDCTFTNCSFRYSGLGPTGLTRCNIDNFHFLLGGAAKNTVVMLAAMHKAGGAAKEVIEQIIGEVQGKPRPAN